MSRRQELLHRRLAHQHCLKGHKEVWCCLNGKRGVCVSKKLPQTAYMKFLKMVFWSSFISTIHLHVLNKILYFSLGLQDTVR